MVRFRKTYEIWVFFEKTMVFFEKKNDVFFEKTMVFLKKILNFSKIGKGGKFGVECVSNHIIPRKCLPLYLHCSCEFFAKENQTT